MPSIGKGPRHADSADGIQLVSIVQHLRFQGLRDRTCSKTVRCYCVGHCFNSLRRMSSQELASHLGSR
jgi:hypothetical protein